eukprot:Sspe_Gene.100811::Locus_75466_Transcript_1_1_Confidence_1.000_Length_1664::g.100811::m.100811
MWRRFCDVVHQRVVALTWRPNFTEEQRRSEQRMREEMVRIHQETQGMLGKLHEQISGPGATNQREQSELLKAVLFNLDQKVLQDQRNMDAVRENMRVMERQCETLNRQVVQSDQRNMDVYKEFRESLRVMDSQVGQKSMAMYKEFRESVHSLMESQREALQKQVELSEKRNMDVYKELCESLRNMDRQRDALQQQVLQGDQQLYREFNKFLHDAMASQNEKLHNDLRSMVGDMHYALQQQNTRSDQKNVDLYREYLSRTEDMYQQQLLIKEEEIAALQSKNQSLSQEVENHKLAATPKLPALKGKVFEEEMVEELVQWSDTKGGGAWEVTRTSQVGGQGDVQIEHADSKLRGLIELKNSQKVSRRERERFEANVAAGDFDVGIMISTGPISTKPHLHRQIVQGYPCWYLQHFDVSMIDMVFYVLRFEKVMKESGEQRLTEQHKAVLRSQYDDVKRNLTKAEDMVKSFSSSKEQISTAYRALYNEDITAHQATPKYQVKVPKGAKLKTEALEAETGGAEA